MRAEHSPSKPHASANQRRVERFVEKYVDSQAKAELLRVLAFRPNEFQTLPEILALTTSDPGDIEGAIFALREFGLVQLKEGPKGTAVALAHDSVARRLAPALWVFLKKAAVSGQAAEGVVPSWPGREAPSHEEGNNASLRLSRNQDR